MHTNLTYVKVKSADEDLQRVLDHFWLGRLEKVLSVHTTLVCGDVIPLFLCKTTKGNFLIIKTDTRYHNLPAKRGLTVKKLENDLELKKPTSTNGIESTNGWLTHVGTYYFFIYPCSKKCDSVLGN